MTSQAKALPRRNAAPNTRPRKPPARSATRSGTTSGKPSAAPTRPPRGSRPRCAPAAAPKEAAKKESRKEARSRGARCAVRSRGYPNAVDPKYSKETASEAAIPHLRRSIQRQQGRQRQWRAEVDPEGRRLLQRMHQEAEGRGLASKRRGRGRMLRPRLHPAEQLRPSSVLRHQLRALRGPHVRETAGSGRTRSSRTKTPARRLPRLRQAGGAIEMPDILQPRAHRRLPPRWRQARRSGPIAGSRARPPCLRYSSARK